MTTATANISELATRIQKANLAYYRPGLSSLDTDAQYDALKAQLRALDPEHPLLTQVGCPYDPEELRTKCEHLIPMGSLDNTEDGIKGYRPWFDATATALRLHTDPPAVVASHKVDGGSICLSYRDGQLFRAATRGNGEYGDDVTINVSRFQNIPLYIDCQDELEIRGEAIMFREEFETYCDLEEIADEDRSNPRNIGNGIIGRTDGQYSELLRFMAFNIVGKHFDTVMQRFRFLAEQGFEVVPHRLCAETADVIEYYDEINQVRQNLPFEIDGVVVILDRVDLHAALTTDRKSLLRPKFARAIKFDAPKNTTVIEDVLITIGHTGAIIPTAVLKEVRVGGVNVSRALLNNWEEIARLDVAIGDTVVVCLAGDIIPKVQSVVSRPESIYQCPDCGFVGSLTAQEEHHGNTRD